MSNQKSVASQPLWDAPPHYK